MMCRHGLAEAGGAAMGETVVLELLRQQYRRAGVMAIGLVSLQAIGTDMAASQLDLESGTRFAEVMQADQGRYPTGIDRLGARTGNRFQQRPGDGGYIEEMGEQRVAGLLDFSAVRRGLGP